VTVGAFGKELSARNPDPAGRRWLFVPYDQLSGAMGPLSREDPSTLGIVLVETTAKGSRRPYHRQKLALVLANLRHFALEQAARGVAVRHVAGSAGYRDLLEPVIAQVGPLRVMEPAERELRVELEPLVRTGGIELLPHEGWLTPPDALERSQAGPPWRMDRFYRWVRRETGILMDGGSPVGGRFSFDGENREPWKGEPPAAVEPTFPMDPVKQEVLEFVERRFAHHPGELRPDHLPARKEDAAELWRWARESCLPHFGPFEDAMSMASTTLFHSRISSLVNLHRLLPREVLSDVLALELPLSSQEGFVRQLLGWREFVRHVHRATDGFRELPGGPLATGEPLPDAWWGTPSGLHCLDRVVSDVWREGYSHHITRLMVLSNLALLLDVDPRALTDWFWVAYTDAYDWVVEPNVLGMGTFAAGDLMTTKPYVSGAAYLDRMGDYCGDCAFDPKGNCPVTPMYWAFLQRHRSRREGNQRMSLPLASAAKRKETLQERDRTVFGIASRRLQAGLPVRPEDLPPP